MELKEVFSVFKKKFNLELISILIIFIILMIDIIYYSRLPLKIPVHFNLKGVPDSYGNKIFIFTLPAVMILNYLILLAINIAVNLDNSKMYFSLWFLSFSLLLIIASINIGVILIVFGKIENLFKIVLIPVLIFLGADFQLIYNFIKQKKNLF